MTVQDSNASQSEAPSEEKLSIDDGKTAPRFVLIEILTQLALRKWLIAKVTGASVLIGIVLSFALPVRYTAVTEIMPPRQTQSSAVIMNSQLGIGALSELGGGTGIFRDPNAVYIGLLESRPIEDAIVNQFGLLKEYHAKDMSAARNKLADNTNIASEKSTLISISVVDKDKKRAADMANAYVDGLRTLSKSISVTEASRRRLFFENQLQTQKEALIAAEAEFQNVQQNKGLVRLDIQANMILTRLAGLRSEIAAKEVELQALEASSTEQNPEVQVAERELSAMKQEATQLEQHSDSSGFSDLGLRDVPNAGLDYIRAQRELLFQQSLFELLLKQYEAARMDEAKEAVVIQVVVPAIVPDRRSAPKRRVIVTLSAFLGFVFGCILALFLRWRDLVLSDPDGAKALRSLKHAFIRRVP